MPGDLGSRNPITGIAACCARAASGQAAAAPPRRVMKSRLRMGSPNPETFSTKDIGLVEAHQGASRPLYNPLRPTTAEVGHERRFRNVRCLVRFRQNRTCGHRPGPVFDVKVLGRPGCCSGMRAIGSGKLLDSSFLAGDMLMVGLL